MKIILALLMMVGFSALGQTHVCKVPYSIESNDVKYEFVESVDSSSSAELQSRFKRWVAITFNSAPDVIKLDDPIGGEIIVKGLFVIDDVRKLRGKVVGVNKWNCRFNVTAQFKDGRYKVLIDGFNYDYQNDLKISVWQMHHGQTTDLMIEAGLNSESQFVETLESLTTSLKKELSISKSSKSDW